MEAVIQTIGTSEAPTMIDNAERGLIELFICNNLMINSADEVSAIDKPQAPLDKTSIVYKGNNNNNNNANDTTIDEQKDEIVNVGTLSLEDAANDEDEDDEDDEDDLKDGDDDDDDADHDVDTVAVSNNVNNNNSNNQFQFELKSLQNSSARKPQNKSEMQMTTIVNHNENKNDNNKKRTKGMTRGKLVIKFSKQYKEYFAKILKHYTIRSFEAYTNKMSYTLFNQLLDNFVANNEYILKSIDYSFNEFDRLYLSVAPVYKVYKEQTKSEEEEQVLMEPDDENKKLEQRLNNIRKEYKKYGLQSIDENDALKSASK